MANRRSRTRAGLSTVSNYNGTTVRRRRVRGNDDVRRGPGVTTAGSGAYKDRSVPSPRITPNNEWGRMCVPSLCPGNYGTTTTRIFFWVMCASRTTSWVMASRTFRGLCVYNYGTWRMRVTGTRTGTRRTRTRTRTRMRTTRTRIGTRTRTFKNGRAGWRNR